MPFQYNIGGNRKWSIVKILGNTIAKARTLSYIFALKEKNALFADNVGRQLQRKKLNGEKLWKILA